MTEIYNKKGEKIKWKNKTGITLIALIITIIVMGILVSVTINFVTNGGIIGKSKEAARQMQIEADRESLLSEVVAAYDVQTGFISFEELNEGIKNIEFTGFNGEYTSKSGNKFYVNETSGIITLAAN